MVILEVKGVNAVIKNFGLFRQNMGRHLERGLVRAGRMIMRESQQLVPVQTGFLKSSGDIRKAGSGMHTDVVVGYFGVYYAAYVHQIPNPPHAHGQEFNIKHLEEIIRAGRWFSYTKTHRTHFKPYGFAGTAEGGMFPRKPQEQWKYLERPVREKQPEVLRILREEASKAK